VGRRNKQVQYIQHTEFMDMRPRYAVFVEPRRRYGFFHFLGDSFMTIMTVGFWLIWIYVREQRRRP
jgi:hypothetical protein